MKNILVKGSGDVADSQSFFDFVVNQAREKYVVLIPGAGTKISEALKEAGFRIEFDALGRRITKTFREHLIMSNVLEMEKKRLEERFADTGVDIISPILFAGYVLCPINGDDLVKAYELGFDEIVVFTTKERMDKKKEIFKNFPKVKIIGVSDDTLLFDVELSESDFMSNT